tara:strand:+ start:208 stop:345 length:138 start_codon:yes stop_codon:yes gene_type:complete
MKRPTLKETQAMQAKQRFEVINKKNHVVYKDNMTGTVYINTPPTS